MKIYLYSFMVALLLFGCSSKVVEIGTNPQIKSQYVKNALNNYIKAKKDQKLNQIASKELYKASKIARVLSQETNPRLANHYAYLLNNQVKIARLLKRKQDVIEELNDVITKRNQAIEDAKHQDDLDEDEKDILPVTDENEIKEKFAYKNSASFESYTINGKYFDGSDVVFNKELKAFISYLVTYLQNNPTKIVILESFTDGVGSSSYSIDMALRRANRIKEELVDQDIDEDRIKVDAKGSVNFIASNDTEDGRRQNNRIIIKIK